MKLVKELQTERNTEYCYHDFGVVAEIADRVAVLKQGELVELGDARRCFQPRFYATNVSSIRPRSRTAERVPNDTRSGVSDGISLQDYDTHSLFGGRWVSAAKAVNINPKRPNLGHRWEVWFWQVDGHGYDQSKRTDKSC